MKSNLHHIMQRKWYLILDNESLQAIKLLFKEKKLNVCKKFLKNCYKYAQ